MRPVSTLVAIAFASFLVSACGGGGGGGDGGAGGGTQPPASFAVGTTTMGSGSGTISPASRTVTSGGTTSFTISLGSSSSIGGISGCGGTLSGNTYTTAPITANCVVTASFTLDAYTVTATAGVGGSITPASATVNHGSTASFMVTPASGYTIESVSGCGGALSGNTFTTSATTGNCSVSASFTESGTTPPPPVGSHTVAATTTGTGSGTISPTQALVPQGQTATFQAVPSTGSTITSVTGCGGSLSGSIYTTGAINSNCVVTAAFELKLHMVTTISSEGGAISPFAQQVVDGETASFMMIPEVGHYLGYAGGCGGNLQGDKFTTAPVTAECTIQADFLRNRYAVTATAGPGGSVSWTSNSGEHGQVIDVIATPDAGFEISSVSGCGGSLVDTVYTTGPLLDDCTIHAVFSNGLLHVTGAAGAGGAIYPTATNVASGDTATFSIVPESGFRIDEVTGCGGALNNDTYVTGPVTVDCTVYATFLDQTLVLSVMNVAHAEVTLSWSDIGAHQYNIYYADEPIGDPSEISHYPDPVIRTAVVSPFVATGLRNNVTYYFTLEAQENGSTIAFTRPTPATPVGFFAQINDTGWHLFCGDATSNSRACPQAGFPNQDAEFGRDALARTGALPKVGGGVAGFDFTKLDIAGNDLPANAPQWACVRDNHTGLVWEEKQTSGLRNYTSTYTRFNPDPSTNGGDAGIENGGTCEASNCDTLGFVNAVNAQALCGFSDWRMPTRSELSSLVFNGRTSTGAMIDTNYFRNTVPARYLTGGLLSVVFHSGYDAVDGGHIRLVRHAQ